jgi:hypothetical protein
VIGLTHKDKLNKNKIKNKKEEEEKEGKLFPIIIAMPTLKLKLGILEFSC